MPQRACVMTEQQSVVVRASGLLSTDCRSGVSSSPTRDTSCFLEQKALSKFLSTGRSQEMNSAVNETSCELLSQLNSYKFVLISHFWCYSIKDIYFKTESIHWRFKVLKINYFTGIKMQVMTNLIRSVSWHRWFLWVNLGGKMEFPKTMSYLMIPKITWADVWDQTQTALVSAALNYHWACHTEYWVITSNYRCQWQNLSAETTYYLFSMDFSPVHFGIQSIQQIYVLPNLFPAILFLH